MPEDNFMESVLSFQLYGGSRDRTQIIRLSQQTPLPTKPSHQPKYKAF